MYDCAGFVAATGATLRMVQRGPILKCGCTDAGRATNRRAAAAEARKARVDGQIKASIGHRIF